MPLFHRRKPTLCSLLVLLSRPLFCIFGLSFAFLRRMHFPLFILSIFLYLPLPALSDPLYKVCGGSSTFSENSTYQSNINLLSSSLEANSTSSGFAAGTVGSVPNRVSGLVLCRGDVNSSSCSSCLSFAFQVEYFQLGTVFVHTD
jgi:Salt stress response/antifungal